METGQPGRSPGAHERIHDMALGLAKRLAAFLGAKSASALLPHVAKRPELLGPLLDKLKATALANIRAKGEFPPRMMESKIHAIEMIYEMVRTTLPRLAPAVQRKLVMNMWYNQLVVGEPVRDAYMAEHGEWPPTMLAISPSMRCNLRCEGCYAAEYEQYGELSPDEFVEIVRQGKEDFGAYLYVILGGEPTAWPPIWDCLERHPDVLFQLYTHGQLIDDAVAKRAAALGNVFFSISVEGGREETDARRGSGTYDRITTTMGRLRDAGVLYGFSATHTTKNHHAITSENFYRDMLDKGCSYGWVFQYAPMGRRPSLDLLPSPEQRLERAAVVERFRENNPLVIFDFWNDGETTDGCMAFGRRYLHVLSSGMVEPCVFVHFATDNVRDKPLKEILQSDFFRDGRRRAPYHPDRRAPCSFIDNPEVLKDLVKTHSVKPTHEGANSIVEELHEPLKERAERYKQLLAESAIPARTD
jgi:MoaA/NifB/PqqE/SkfB family radical SAM enzyme